MNCGRDDLERLEMIGRKRTISRYGVDGRSKTRAFSFVQFQEGTRRRNVCLSPIIVKLNLIERDIWKTFGLRFEDVQIGEYEFKGLILDPKVTLRHPFRKNLLELIENHQRQPVTDDVMLARVIIQNFDEDEILELFPDVLDAKSMTEWLREFTVDPITTL